MSGFCGGTIGDNDLADVWNVLGDTDKPSLSAKPGEPSRNREQRCEHGFVEGKACQVCHCSTRRAATSGPNANQMSEGAVTRRVEVARKIAHGHCTVAAIAAAMETTIGSVTKTIAGMRRAQLVTVGATISLTDRGKDML